MHEEIELLGEELLGLEYEPIFPYFKNTDNAFKIIHGDFVSTQDGSGAVHIASGFGEDDFNISKENGIPVLCPVDDAGCFTIHEKLEYELAGKKEILDLKNKQVFDTNDDIIKYLKSKDLWMKTEQYLHNYPHCWRTDTPLIYKAISSWYVKVTDPRVKDRMVELNKDINWIPAHIRDGLFGKWIENARDWGISRNRFWGAPVPVWRFCDIPAITCESDLSKTEKDKLNNQAYNESKTLQSKIKELAEKNNLKFDNYQIVFGSISELESFFSEQYTKDHVRGLNSGKYIDENGKFSVGDLHRPYIDELVIRDENDDIILQRVEDVLDCWFESGAMPFASVHYPFENKQWFEEHCPADFIVEYLAQTRGWFYTLMVLGVALFDKAPFKNCICHGVILDEKGQKLSKRLKNYPDAKEMFDTVGSDAMRWAMLRTQVMRGLELRIDKNGEMFKEAIKTILNPLWNTYTFFTTYQKIDQIKINDKPLTTNEMDLYILAKFKLFTEKYLSYMDAYDTSSACFEAEIFIDILNNWYIRRNKDRFWSNVYNQDKCNAYDTLYFVLNNTAILLSPMLPFLTEEIYLGLQNQINKS